MTELISIVAREGVRILGFIGGAFARTWPLWAVSIPLAAAVRMSPLSGRLKRVMSMKPVAAVVAATLFGAFSPLCSCSVIPVIFSLLSAGVPIAPVMAFWLASPSMDPEIFFLSVSTIGWPLAIARFAAATLMSLGGGLLAIALDRRGYFSGGVLRESGGREQPGCACSSAVPAMAPAPIAPRCACSGSAGATSANLFSAVPGGSATATSGLKPRLPAPAAGISDERGRAGRLARRFGEELLSSVLFVGKFMAVAFALEAAIKFYVPEAWIRAALGAENIFAVPIAVLVGIPFYTTNAQALGMIGGLLGKGMSEGAALSFLIGGATTTLPAMSAVFGIAKPRVFAVYLGSAVIAALASGLLWSFF
ncbi:MAG: hypothetical protein CVV47_02500 [Spirochaetae bacterium HGW-Spirochaetae-3]|jgi:hypothetical protein|nr:MAG: hypothetical protein CVV47_02500 [Spirochaetae bacterium HGW-Spirochaetae-3]